MARFIGYFFQKVITQRSNSKQVQSLWSEYKAVIFNQLFISYSDPKVR